MPPYIAHYRSNWFDQRFRFRFRLFGNNPPNAHRSQIKMCEKRQTRNVQFRFMQNAFRILKPIQKSSKCVWVFRNTGANAFAKNQMRLAYEDKRDLYCSPLVASMQFFLKWPPFEICNIISRHLLALYSHIIPLFTCVLVWEIHFWIYLKVLKSFSDENVIFIQTS